VREVITTGFIGAACDALEAGMLPPARALALISTIFKRFEETRGVLKDKLPTYQFAPKDEAASGSGAVN